MSQMSHPTLTPPVHLDGPVLKLAETHLAAAVGELTALGEIVARALSRLDGHDPDARGVTRMVIQRAPASTDADGGAGTLTVSFCRGSSCIGVFDAVRGVARPAGPSDTGCDPVSLPSIPPPPAQAGPLLPGDADGGR